MRIFNSKRQLRSRKKWFQYERKDIMAEYKAYFNIRTVKPGKLETNLLSELKGRLAGYLQRITPR